LARVWHIERRLLLHHRHLMRNPPAILATLKAFPAGSRTIRQNYS
jgi:hypothetical protein